MSSDGLIPKALRSSRSTSVPCIDPSPRTYQWGPSQKLESSRRVGPERPRPWTRKKSATCNMHASIPRNKPLIETDANTVSSVHLGTLIRRLRCRRRRKSSAKLRQGTNSSRCPSKISSTACPKWSSSHLTHLGAPWLCDHSTDREVPKNGKEIDDLFVDGDQEETYYSTSERHLDFCIALVTHFSNSIA